MPSRERGFNEEEGEKEEPMVTLTTRHRPPRPPISLDIVVASINFTLDSIWYVELIILLGRESVHLVFCSKVYRQDKGASAEASG